MGIKMYKKEIIYMSLYDNDVKEGCVGYLKSEERQEKFKLELQIKNVSEALTGNYPIRLQSIAGWQEDGVLMLKDGCGMWTGNAAEPILRAEIILSDAYKIKGQSKNASVPEEQTVEQQDMTESGEHDAGQQDVAEAPENEPRQQTMIESAEKKPIQQAMTRSAEKKPIQQITPETGTNRHIKTEPAPKAENPPLYESKWEQLLATYERIHPYGDNRVYVKLEPKDFVILPSGYQHLVNNSFLLHGFYNYRYLILGKEKDFYLGVPGVFYEREKMVALMFGFEAFECEGGNAEEGKFGYYLRKVEL